MSLHGSRDRSQPWGEAKLDGAPPRPSEPDDGALPVGGDILSACHAPLRRFARGALLTTAGGPAEALYVLRRGHVRVYRLTEAAAEATTAVLGPGQLVGLSALLGQPEYHTFAEALTPVEAWVLPAARLADHLAQHPALAEFLVDALVRHLPAGRLAGVDGARPAGDGQWRRPAAPSH